MIRRIESAALLVRSVAYGEADLVATFFTRDAGRLGAMVRGARKSTRRFGGALEPIHGLFVVLEDRGKELCLLKEARIDRPRSGISASLEAMEAAGQALRWVRHLCPPRTPEPAAFVSLEALLDGLDGDEGDTLRVRARLAAFGLRLLGDMGYGLDLERCTRCGRACPEGRPAFVDPSGGGLVCTGCGGAKRTMAADVRSLAVSIQRGAPASLTPEAARAIVAIVEEAMAAHTGFDPGS